MAPSSRALPPVEALAALMSDAGCVAQSPRTPSCEGRSTHHALCMARALLSHPNEVMEAFGAREAGWVIAAAAGDEERMWTLADALSEAVDALEIAQGVICHTRGVEDATYPDCSESCCGPRRHQVTRLREVLGVR